MSDTDSAITFAERLRALADLYDSTPGLPTPRGDVRLFVGDFRLTREENVALFNTARQVAAAEPTVEEYHVRLEVLPGIVMDFDKSQVGEKRTVTREVEEYVLADAAPVPA